MSAKLRGFVPEILEAISILGSEDPSEWSSDYGLKMRVLEIVGLSDAKTNVKTVESGLNKIAKCSKGGLVIVGDRVEVPETTLNSIMARIDQMHSEMVEQSRTELPPTPRIDCKDCQYYSVCTKELIVPEADDDE